MSADRAAERATVPLALFLVEDNEADIVLLTEAFEDAGIDVDLEVARDGERALDFLRQVESGVRPAPDLVVVDLNLPRVSGLEVLDHVKSHPELRLIPTIVMTTSRSPGDVRDAYQRFANTFISKPRDPRDLLDAVRCIHRYWLDVAGLPTRPSRSPGRSSPGSV